MDIDFPKLEKKILNFWKENNVFEKSILQRKKAQNFVFFEGPPTANGKPGIHHVLSRVFKDIICRYKTMQGFRVQRKAGWDTQGLPVELQIEKKLGFKNKKDIEKFGIAKFNRLCKESVWEYKKDWENLTERIAFWLDLKNPYITYETNYIESVWWIIKQIYQKGFIYQGHKVVPFCTRCGTSLSSHEVALGYEKVKETSVYIKFKVLSTKEKWQNVSILSWTTTPWTLPGNVALAINPESAYVKAEVENEILILAKERLNVLDKDYKILEELKGSSILGLSYQPLFNIPQLKTQNAYKVYPADFVTMEEGTGVVHIAVMYGEDDYNLGKKENLPTFHTVTEEGKFIENMSEGLAGLYVKSQETELLIINYLGKKGFLFREEPYLHDYPFCWRCNSPLIYYAKQSWFINMQQVKEDLIENNRKINWVPGHLKEGRFGEWLREVKDWAFSRERYWGTPLPVWQCSSCKNKEIIGSLKDLLSQKFSDNSYFIIRHGDSLRQKKKICVCWPEKIFCPLTAQGKKEVKNSAKKLKEEKIDLIFSSDLLRAKQTAEILSKETGAEVIFDKRLREFDVGIFNNKKPDLTWQYLAKKGNSTEVKLPQGESLSEIKKRMYDFLQETDGKYKNKKIVIASHELPITILEETLNGLPLEKILRLRQIKREKLIRTGKFRKIEFKNLPCNEEMELDFHRPYIDEIKFHCPKCGELMERVTELMDCWFDSGSMPFAQYHYPFENKALIEKGGQFPAEYISEAVDQTRGWFYTLHAISNLLGKGIAYKNVISLGHVLDEKGEKMSKSKGNIVDPWYIIEKYGADATRWYFYTVNQPGEVKLFAEKDVETALKKFILTFWNSFLFFETYGVKSKTNPPAGGLKPKNILDRWIISRWNSLLEKTTEELDNYDITGAARRIESFAVEDLSQWYIRRSRRRFQKPETKTELKEASETLGLVLSTLSKITAPFIPFLSEEIYQKTQNAKYKMRNAVHLKDWPKTNKKLIDVKLEEKMEKTREIVTLALAERAKIGIKVRQPLGELQITNDELQKELLELIKEEINVKRIAFGKTLKLDAKITDELKKEGEKREIIRNVKDLRKELGLSPQYIVTSITSTATVVPTYMEKEEFKKEMGAKKFIKVEKENEMTGVDVKKEIKLEGKKHYIGIKKK